MSKIKVLEMIDQPFLGGGQINLLALASTLDKSRFEVIVCSADGGALVDEVKRRGVEHFSVPFSKKFRTKTVASIVDILRDQNVSLLHTHGGVAGFYGRWAARKCRLPVVVHTLHGIHYLHYRNTALKLFYICLEKMCSRLTDAVVFVCDSDKESGRRFGLVPQDKSFVIKNGVDFSVLESHSAAAEERLDWEEKLGTDLSGPVIGTVARLHRQKGISDFLLAAQKMTPEIPGLKVLIVGGGPLREKLEEMRRRLGLEGKVHFLGERKEAFRLIALLDVFVLPSLWEGLPYSLMEAAALEKPVVASAVDGIKELISDGRTGVLVPPKNPERLAAAVLELLKDKEKALRMGSELKRDIQSRYSLRRMVHETESLYLKLFLSKSRL